MFDGPLGFLQQETDACGTIRHMKKEKVGGNRGLSMSLALEMTREIVKESSL